MCKCKSYNKQTGEVPEVVLDAPDWSRKESICIDACIADVIKELWDKGITTGGSCCGHNKENPSVIVWENEDVNEAFSVISKVDSRSWTVLRWELKEHTSNETGK
jgi:hypothetical protein